MATVASEDRLRLDLAAARRASTMVTDPLSTQMLHSYISELERRLYPMDGGFSIRLFGANG
ncbi:hypothetical protein J2Y58_001453 [Sphingomonas sp. BE138]|uniref:hypothetical protein n=1 Tax=Sphingomonas sp. BE138 TaxID=2817845 RepID=UPI002858BEE9|nr:hypothetical protein [Sphingomonas sp. BE138]MDR6788095.1 hypothetical protein [Sphingomonas sp. BE138]